jgi:hypothetical protein
MLRPLHPAKAARGNAHTDCAAVHTKNSESAMQQRITLRRTPLESPHRSNHMLRCTQSVNPQCTQRLPRRNDSSLTRVKAQLCCAAFRPGQGLARIFQRDNACATLVLAVALQQIIDRA